MHKQVLITAGGAGRRMGSSLPKQLMPLGGRPLLFHVFEQFLRYSPELRFVLVLPEAAHEPWKALCLEHRFHGNHELVEGGPTRFHSVKNGLKLIPTNCLVAIHDGVRPLVSLETISRVFQFAEKFGNAIPVVGVNDSVRIREQASSHPLPREHIRLVQTPQCFHSDLIREAYNCNYHETFTDDASVLESAGERLFLTDGNYENIKVTTPADFVVAEAFLRHLSRKS